jgi:hypothetical protein
MSLPKQFESMAWCIDVIVVPIFGLLFILCSGVGTMFSEMTFNDQKISYAAEPLKFAAVILGGMAIGLACMVYGVVRFAFNRRQNKF